MGEREAEGPKLRQQTQNQEKGLKVTSGWATLSRKYALKWSAVMKEGRTSESGWHIERSRVGSIPAASCPTMCCIRGVKSDFMF